MALRTISKGCFVVALISAFPLPATLAAQDRPWEDFNRSRESDPRLGDCLLFEHLQRVVGRVSHLGTTDSGELRAFQEGLVKLVSAEDRGDTKGCPAAEAELLDFVSVYLPNSIAQQSVEIKPLVQLATVLLDWSLQQRKKLLDKAGALSEPLNGPIMVEDEPKASARDTTAELRLNLTARANRFYVFNVTLEFQLVTSVAEFFKLQDRKDLEKQLKELGLQPRTENRIIDCWAKLRPGR